MGSWSLITNKERELHMDIYFKGHNWCGKVSEGLGECGDSYIVVEVMSERERCRYILGVGLWEVWGYMDKGPTCEIVNCGRN